MTISQLSIPAPVSGASSLVGLAARALIAPLFLVSAGEKIAAPQGTIAYIASAGLPLPQVAFAGALFVELVCGLALLVGYRTRSVAWVMAGFTLVAAAFFHNQFADGNQLIHFLKNLSIAGGLLQVAATGPGRYSIDAWRR